MQGKETLILISAFLLVYFAFLIWYGGKCKPVTIVEIDFYLDKIRKHHSVQNQQDHDILLRLRNMAEKDDGKDFYMVNLIQYKTRDEEELRKDPMVANRRYGQKMLPLLLKNGCHPVISSNVTSSFIDEGSQVAWDNVSIVRYRSMRDFLKVTTENSTRGFDIDKWASIEKTQVFPTQPVIRLIFVRFNIASILLLVALSIHFLLLT